MITVKKAKVGKIFEGENSLHLVIWDRFCEASHISGLALMRQLVEQFDLVMPMLRPLGRGSTYYTHDAKTDFKEPPPNRLCQAIPSAPLLDKSHTGHCELWMQVGDSSNSDLIDFLGEHIRAKNTALGVFLDRKNHLWEPLGGSSVDTCAYAKSLRGLGTNFLRDIAERQIPAFLKLIWYRSSAVIAEWFSRHTHHLWIDPLSQRNVIHALMSEIFTDISPEEYGLSSSFESVDPSTFGVAHMAASAINAITRVSHFYQIEQYFPNLNATHPHCFPSRESFLEMFCT